ncbi:uncharacterized protein LOC143891648 isoform X2 [Tasmannia lanceolata]
MIARVLHSAMIDLSIIKISRCMVYSSFSSIASKFNYHAFEKDTDLLSRLDHKDWLAPNEVLKIFKSLKDPELVISVFKKVSKRMDFKPDEALYSVIIEKLACARKFDAVDDLLGRMKDENCKLSDEFFYRLIKIYGNVANNQERAIETLFKMPDFHCWPTIKTFNFVLNMLVCTRQFDVIHEVYLSAPRLGVALDTCCFNILIKGLCQCDKLDAAFELLHEFPKQGCRPNVTTYSTLMHCLCKHDKVDEAFELFERMEKEGYHPDSITFNILISGLCKQGRVVEATELLDKMRLKGCSPNSGSYQAVLYGLLSCDRFVEAKDFMNRMVSDNFHPSFLSYKLLIDGLCTQNLLNDVDLVLKQMVRQGFVPRMGTWKKILEIMFIGKNDYYSINYENNIMKIVI